jgi:hypothetical protein
VLLALLALAIVAAALAAPLLFRAAESWSARRARGRRSRRVERRELRDPGRERRAEQRARELLRSCVNDEEWGMYRDLGFIRVTGRMSQKRRRGDRLNGSGRRGAGEGLDSRDGGVGSSPDARTDPALDGGMDSSDALDRVGGLLAPGRLDAGEDRNTPAGDSSDPRELPGALDGADRSGAAGALPRGAETPGASGGSARSGSAARGRETPDEAPYAYLIYPHKPIVAYVPKTGRLLSEYCVEFPDLTGAISQTRLPDSDDVLAKWMALTGDEERLIRNANMHLPGRQVDPGRVRRDLWRLSEWERQRRGSGPVRAPRS